ncbi:Citrate (Si)-synthase [Geobacter metallireducens RCH3]|uniref:citrate synthase (unknown stereospecificity) n=2 Tax=Geobacter metallireducens TaxID=28232 RepID=Q39WL2_GEOMG|nr:citrate (Si)-synthase [Geobacter metallireducens]AAS67340.1 citrate synthase [Geobacter metallireducens]ABB31362.1 citrate synthase [Geobacter metallireducens GS-15]EHP86170.1 Citrate (Si)-synthase [Geobacter metallireducens RCH3]
MGLKETLKQKIEEFRPRTTRLVKEFGKVKIDEVTIEQCIGGARDIRSLVTDISYLDPQEGIRFRGKTIPETFAALPKAPGSDYPTVESFWYFLLTGEVPTQAQVDEVLTEWKVRQEVPQYVFDTIRTLPRDSHPMAMLSVGITAMQRDSKFAALYNAGKFNKLSAWESVYEDACDIVARIPVIAAFIYNLKYKGDKQIAIDPALDMGANFAHMIDQGDAYKDVARMYFILHSDHESGNVSAHTTHLVHSALSDPYYAYAAGLNGLAGPLHGRANQEVLDWTIKFQEKYCKDQEPTKELITRALWDTLNSGQVIPGYGHAVLRKTDPRYISQREFCQKHLPEDPLFKLVSMIFEVAPGVLTEHGKTKNPWPNVDAQSGVIQWHYGVKEWDFYTVLFGVGRALGCMANITWDRGLGYAIERPKSVTTPMLEEWAAKGGRL